MDRRKVELCWLGLFDLWNHPLQHIRYLTRNFGMCTQNDCRVSDYPKYNDLLDIYCFNYFCFYFRSLLLQMRGLSRAFVSTHNMLCFIFEHYERHSCFSTVGCPVKMLCYYLLITLFASNNHQPIELWIQCY